jgi:antibiotic biosynthesis monooxygenase (ABM) superfamily enzyme
MTRLNKTWAQRVPTEKPSKLAVIYTAILVVSLTYFAIPILNRLLRRWLYPGSV